MSDHSPDSFSVLTSAGVKRITPNTQATVLVYTFAGIVSSVMVPIHAASAQESPIPGMTRVTDGMSAEEAQKWRGESLYSITDPITGQLITGLSLDTWASHVREAQRAAYVAALRAVEAQLAPERARQQDRADRLKKTRTNNDAGMQSPIEWSIPGIWLISSGRSGSISSSIPTFKQDFSPAPNIKGWVGGKYSTLLGPIAEADIAFMIGDSLAMDLGGSVGPKQRELLARFGWQFSKNGMLRVTVQELNQLLRYAFVAGDEEVWMVQRTFGGTLRFNFDRKFLQYLEAQGYISKSESKELGTKRFTMNGGQIWESTRRIGGVEDNGISLTAGIQAGLRDTIRATIGLSHKTKDLQYSSGEHTEYVPTGWLSWTHDWGRVVNGFTTGIAIDRNATGYGIEGNFSKTLWDNFQVRGTIRHDWRDQSMWLVGGGDETRVWLQGVWQLDTRRSPVIPTPSPQSSATGNHRGERANHRPPLIPDNAAERGRMMALIDWVRQRSVEKDFVEAYAEELLRRIVAANSSPTANNFTHGTNIGNTAKTFNWKTSSGATDADGDALTATVLTNGTKGVFSIAGDNITYTPNAGQTGSDSGTITILDGNGGTKNIAITVNGIDMVAPSKTGESFPNFDTAGAGFSGTMTFDEAVATVVSVTVSNGGAASVTAGTGTTTLTITGTAGADPGTITIVVRDSAGNQRTIVSNNYTLF